MKEKNAGTWIAVTLLLLAALGLLVLAGRLLLRPAHPYQAESELLGDADAVVQALHEAALETEPAEPMTEPVTERRETEMAPDEAAPEGETQEAAQETSHPVTIFVGDSRTVGMSHPEWELGDPCVYIGESGEGYLWFAETGIDLMSDAIRDHPEAPVVLNLGVNDTESIDDYIALYETFPEIWPDTAFYFLSVNPVTRDSEHVHNSDILLFNQAMQRRGPFPYLDSFTWMLSGGFVSVDGVHYSEETYCLVHDFVIASITGAPLPVVPDHIRQQYLEQPL